MDLLEGINGSTILTMSSAIPFSLIENSIVEKQVWVFKCDLNLYLDEILVDQNIDL